MKKKLLLAFVLLQAMSAPLKAEVAPTTKTSYESPAQLILDKKLIDAVIVENKDKVQALLDKGARIAHPNYENDNHTALSAALASGFVDIAKQLLAADSKSIPSQRSYFYAARRGDMDVLKTIEKRIGENRNRYYNSSTKCPIYEAIRHGHLEATQHLYSQEKENCTSVLKEAFSHGETEIVSWLLEQEPHAFEGNKAYQKRQILEDVIKNKTVELLEILFNHGITFKDFTDGYLNTDYFFAPSDGQCHGLKRQVTDSHRERL